MRIPLTLICAAIIIANPAIAPGSDEITSFADDLSIRAALSRQSHSFRISETDGEHQVPYETNITWDLGVRANWRGAGLGFTADAPWSRGEEDKGRSSYYAFQAGYFGRSFGAEASYQRYRGFFVPRESLRDPATGDYPREPDLSCTFARLNLYYFFNERFSYRAAFEQTERQDETAASFVLMGYASYSMNSNDSPLIPAAESSYFTGLSELESFRFFSAGLAAGYAFIIPKGPYFASSALLFGNAVQHQHFYAGGKTITRVMGWTPTMIIRLAAGYTGPVYFTGLLFSVDSSKTHYRRVEIELLSLQVSLYSGVRW